MAVTALPQKESLRFLSVKEAAAILQMSPIFIYQQIEKKNVRVKRFGRHIRIPYDEFVKWTAVKGQ